MTMPDRAQHPSAGGTGGAESGPAPAGGPSREDEAPGSGATEIPLGVPMSEEEFRRLKEAARRPGRSGAGEDTAGEQDQDEEHRDEEDRDDRAQEDQP
jgi:hypothetical protein